MPHAFISYVRDDSAKVDRLAAELRNVGIDVWLDRERIRAGQRWRAVIRAAIREGAFFIACFSRAYAERDRSYMNEELTLAIEEIRARPVDRTWFIPVLLDGGEVPDRQFGGGETLRDIQHLDLREWERGVEELVATLTCGTSPALAIRPTENDRQVNARYEIEIVELTNGQSDEGVPNPEPFVIAKRLANFGFKTKLGGWDATRLLARLPPEQVNAVYVIHANDLTLARRIARSLERMEAAPHLAIFSAAETAAASEGLEEDDVIHGVAAFVVFRGAA